MRPRTLVPAAPVRRTAVPARALVALLAVAGLAACGAGDEDDSLASASSPGGERTIEIEMRDNSFAPDEIEVTEGETVRLVFRNEGAVTHDALLGDAAAQDEHEAEMRAEDAAGAEAEGMEGMGHGAEGDDAAEEAITVEPGETGELSYTAAAGDELLVGCHEPGHYEAGMTLAVEVTPAS
jgi:uncharacterized cupredoxin-like copper-binding protein